MLIIIIIIALFHNVWFVVIDHPVLAGGMLMSSYIMVDLFRFSCKCVFKILLPELTT